MSHTMSHPHVAYNVTSPCRIPNMILDIVSHVPSPATTRMGFSMSDFLVTSSVTRPYHVILIAPPHPYDACVRIRYRHGRDRPCRPPPRRVTERGGAGGREIDRSPSQTRAALPPGRGSARGTRAAASVRCKSVCVRRCARARVSARARDTGSDSVNPPVHRRA